MLLDIAIVHKIGANLRIFGKCSKNVQKSSSLLWKNFVKSLKIFGKRSEIFGKSSKTFEKSSETFERKLCQEVLSMMNYEPNSCNLHAEQNVSTEHNIRRSILFNDCKDGFKMVGKLPCRVISVPEQPDIMYLGFSIISFSH